MKNSVYKVIYIYKIYTAVQKFGISKIFNVFLKKILMLIRVAFICKNQESISRSFKKSWSKIFKKKSRSKIKKKLWM